jgi:hypothetical protein
VTNAVVAVMGMHRSGTSATAGMLVGLGLAGPRPADLIPPGPSNESGHWESHAVRRYNRQLLRAVGTSGYAPPAAEPRWADLPDYEDLRGTAQRWVAETGAGKPVMVKDPRMCLTMEFWRQAVPGALAIVLVLRNPLRVARSLEARDHIPMSLGLSLWDRHLRTASDAVAGLPTLVLDYDSMLSDPAAVSDEVCAFLRRMGITVDAETQHAASQRLDARLRHQELEVDEYQEMANVQLESFEILRARRGTHAAWQPPQLPAPQLWVDDVVRLRRDYVVLVDDERQKRKQMQEQGRGRRFASALKDIAAPSR